MTCASERGDDIQREKQCEDKKNVRVIGNRVSPFSGRKRKQKLNPVDPRDYGIKRQFSSKRGVCGCVWWDLINLLTVDLFAEI